MPQPITCPFCQTGFSGDYVHGRVRCPDCGKLIEQAPATPATPTAAAATATDGAWEYATPYGCWTFQPGDGGGWKIAYRFDAEGTTGEKIKTLVTNVAEGVNKLPAERFPKLTGWKDESKSCVWQLPTIAGPQSVTLRSLATQPPPFPQEGVFMIAARLLPVLQENHQQGVAVHDMAPSLVFANRGLEHCIILPTPWLPSQIRWKPNCVQQMPFVAPESEAGQAVPNPLLIDVYGFGALIWFLLTGQQRKSQPAMLPSEFDPEFARWDALIDGCCRTNPARRYQTWPEVAAALQQVKAASVKEQLPIPVPASSADLASEPAPKPRRKGYLGKVLLLLLAVFAVIGFINRHKIAEMVPAVGQPMSGYRRGFGDTILTYKNRSYEGAVWKEVEVSQLSGNNPQLHSVVGWLDDDYWVIAKTGVFRYKNGTWTNPYREHMEDYYYHYASMLDQDTLLFSECRYGIAEGEKTRIIGRDGAQTLCVGRFKRAFYVDNGLLYLSSATISGEIRKATFTNTKTLGDKSTKFQNVTREDKEHRVHKDNNTTTDYNITHLYCIRQIAPGKAMGIVGDCLVEFRNGIWYEITGLPGKNHKSMWIDCSGTTPKHAVVVRDGGQVTIHEFGGGNREMSVPQAQETTSMDLFRVWGNSIDKLWTMDTNGTVWEKNGNDWRVVVRGLRKDDVTFHDAWVAPTGVVYAITKSKLYQLK